MIRTMDALHNGQVPTFSGGDRPDPSSILAASSILLKLGVHVPPLPLAALLNAPLDGSSAEIAAQWLKLGLPRSPSDTDTLRMLAASAPDVRGPESKIEPWVEVRRALGLERLRPLSYGCPSAPRSLDELAAAGVRARLLRLSGTVSCPDMAIPESVRNLGRWLSPRAIEIARALESLREIGVDLDGASAIAERSLVSQVRSVLELGPPSREIIGLLAQVLDVYPGALAGLRPYSETLIASCKRVLRTGGSLPDFVDGEDFVGSMEALRVLRLLADEDPSALAFARGNVFLPFVRGSEEPGAPQGQFAVAIAAELGVSFRTDSLTAPVAPTALLAVSMRGDCLPRATTSQALELEGRVPDYYRWMFSRYRSRCGIVAPVSSNVVGRSGHPSVEDSAAGECSRDGRVSLETVEAAKRQLSWPSWPEVAIDVDAVTRASVASIYRKVLGWRLTEGKCDGFWWYPA